MTNLFLKVNKDLFKLGLNPTEVLLLAQIIEFNTTTGSFFMSDKALAEMLNISESTVSRAMRNMEGKGFIVRETKNTQSGRTRHIKADIGKIESYLATVNLNVPNNQNDCSANVNLTVRNKQNDFIKDNIKDNNKIKEKDNSYSNSAKAELEIALEPPEAEVMTREQVLEMFGLSAVAARVPTNYPDTFWIGQKLIKII